MIQKTVIHRRKREEAEKAIKDLEARGFVVTFPLEEIKSSGKVFNRDSYNRHVFKHNTQSSCWRAQLERVVHRD